MPNVAKLACGAPVFYTIVATKTNGF